MSLNPISSLTPLSLPLHAPPSASAIHGDAPSLSAARAAVCKLNSFTCTLIAPDTKLLRHLAGVARVCARDVGVQLKLESRRRKDAPAGGSFTLHLSAAQAISQHMIWCLACRLACFCPDARVGVLVSATSMFGSGQPASSDAFAAGL